MAIKICLHERPDGKIDYYRIYSNQELSENTNRSAVLYQGWFLNQEHAQKHINCYIQDDRCDFIHFEQETIKINNLKLLCKSWIIFDKENPAEPSDFYDIEKEYVVNFTGSLAKFCEPGPHIIKSSDSALDILKKHLK